jgi:hypothetical protein
MVPALDWFRDYFAFCRADYAGFCRHTPDAAAAIYAMALILSADFQSHAF